MAINMIEQRPAPKPEAIKAREGKEIPKKAVKERFKEAKQKLTSRIDNLKKQFSEKILPRANNNKLNLSVELTAINKVVENFDKNNADTEKMLGIERETGPTSTIGTNKAEQRSTCDEPPQNNSKDKVININAVREKVDLTPETVKKSQEAYIAWRRKQSEGLKPYDFGYDCAVEPGRAAVWAHATSLEGGIRILAGGEIKSAKAALLDSEDLAHAPTNRAVKPTRAMQEGLTLKDMNPEQQEAALNYAKTYISGTLGKCLEGYTPDKIDTSLQAGFVFPLKTLETKGVKFRSSFWGQNNEELPKETLESAQQKLKHLPNKLFANEGSGNALEINFSDVDDKGISLPTKASSEGGILLVQENQLTTVQDRIRKKMQEKGKDPEEIEKRLNQIVPFSSEFKSIDEALGWLTNTPEGNEIVFDKTGIRLEIPQAKIQPEGKYIADFINEYKNRAEEIPQIIQRFKDINQPKTAEEEGIFDRETEFRKKIIDKLQNKLGNYLAPAA